MNCKLIIKDEVNVKFEGLAVETRRKIVNKLKFDLPYARHMPAFKLGRWDGTVSFFGIGGNGFVAHLDIALPIVEESGYDIEVIDQVKNKVFLNQKLKTQWDYKSTSDISDTETARLKALDDAYNELGTRLVSLIIDQF